MYEEDFSYVWEVLRRMGIPVRDREDVAQEVFVAAHKSLPTFDASRIRADAPRRARRAWLHGIAFHLASNYRRLSRNEQEILMERETDPTDRALGPEALTAHQEILHKLLASVDLERRVVLSMHDIDGFTMPEIGQVLGISVPAGDKRLKTAREELAAAAKRMQARDARAAALFAALPMPFDPASFLSAEPSVPDVPPGVRERVWRHLEQALGLEGVGVATGAGASAATAAALSGGHLVGGAALFLAGVGVGALGYHALAPPPSPPPVAVAVAQEAPVAPLAPAGTAAATATPSPNATSAASVASLADDAGLRPVAPVDERSLIERAQSALAHQDFAGAEEALRLHAQKYPKGDLAVDRDMLRDLVRRERQRHVTPAPAPKPAPLFTSAPTASASAPPPRSGPLFGTDN
jgi:RNA polymerase sigma-70 factor (ECF subfamily)